MSWLSKGVHALSVGLGYKALERGISGLIPHAHSADRRAANQAAAEQIDFYQKQKQAMEDESAIVERETKRNKEKIQRKQIRSARAAYRAPGFLDEANFDVSDRLG